MSTPGKIVIISGPSGAGKTTLLKKVIDQCNRPLQMSISATTRSPREGEIDGIDYHFLTDQQFQARRDAGEFLECCEVYGRGYWYGTLLSEVTPSLEQGKWVILEIDIVGMKEVLQKLPAAVTIFVKPSSLEVLEQRLRNRGTDSDAAITRRLEVAQTEMQSADQFQYQVENDHLDQAVLEICKLLESLE